MIPVIIIPSSISEFGLTHSNMIEEVGDQLRNKNVDTLITRWLNMTIFNLAARFNFSFLNSSDSFITADSVRNYPLNQSLLWLQNMWMPGGPAIRPIEPIGERELMIMDPYFNTNKGYPVKYVYKNRSVDLWRVPDQVYTILYTFYRRPMALVGLDDVSDFPYEWHPVIIQGAIVRGFKYEKNDQYLPAVQEYQGMVKELKPTIYRRPDQRNILGTAPMVFREARPSLPSHFPRVP